MSDGKIVIETGLDTSGIEKDLKKVGSTVEKDLGQNITKTMDKAETSIKKMGKAVSGVDFTKIKTQMDNVSKAMESTNTKIDAQKVKLERLKTAYESATNVKAKNKIQEQMQDTEKTITNLETKLSTLGTRMNSLNSKFDMNKSKDAMADLDGEFKTASASVVNSLDKVEKKSEETGKTVKKSLSNIDIGEGISKAGDKISSVGDKLTSRVTFPIVGIGTAAVKMEMDAESSFAKVSTVMDESAMSAEQLKASVVDSSNKSGIAVTDFNEALYETLSAGVDSGKAIEFTTDMTKLAKGGFTETTKAVDVVTSVLNAYGLSADQATSISDKLITTQNIGKSFA